MSNPDRLDLAIFLPSLGGGGAERVMALVARELADCGYKVHIVSATGEPNDRTVVRSGIPIIALRAATTSLALWRLIRYLARERPRVLLTAGEHAAIIALLANRLSGARARTVVGLHGMLSYAFAYPTRRRGRLLPTLARRVFPRADAFVAVSHGAADDLHNWINVPTSRVHVIYNPVLTADVTAAAAAAVDHPWLVGDGAPVVLAVGRLAPEKDFPTLLRAFARARQTCDLRLLILGEGPERERLQELILELGLAEFVSMPGYIANPYAFMSRAAVLVQSSRSEAFGNVIVEALACGCPVVSTDCPSGPAEILEGGRYGELVPVGDAMALSDAVVRVLNARAEPAMGRGRAGEFSLEKGILAYISVLFPDAVSPTASGMES